MSSCIEVHLHRERLPDAGWLAASVSSMEPKFSFVGDYDFTADTGWCPCRLGGAECGFEWELSPPEDVPAELAAHRFDSVARLDYRSSVQDAMCAVLVAANVAAISGGVLVTPEGERIGPDDALTWASMRVRGLAKGTRGRSAKKRAPQEPAELLASWLEALPGTSVEALVRSLPDDPLVAVRYGASLLLRAKRWSVSSPDGGVLSTESLPRRMSDAQIAALEASFQRLAAVLRSGPVVSARFDAATRTLEFAHPGGVFRIAPKVSGERSAYDQMFSGGDRWELENGKTRIVPDEDAGTLVRDDR